MQGTHDFFLFNQVTKYTLSSKINATIQYTSHVKIHLIAVRTSNLAILNSSISSLDDIFFLFHHIYLHLLAKNFLLLTSVFTTSPLFFINLFSIFQRI